MTCALLPACCLIPDQGLRTEKELKAGGEVKELQEEADKLAMK